MDKDVFNRLKEWGLKDRKSGIEAKIIFYGFAGTGKNINRLGICKNFKKTDFKF